MGYPQDLHSLWILSKFTQTCHNYNLVFGCFSHRTPPFLSASLQSIQAPTLSPRQLLISFLSPQFCLFQEFHINRIGQHGGFHVACLSLMCCFVLILSTAVQHTRVWVKHSRSMHSLFDEYLDCFQFGVTINSVVTSTCLQFFVWTYFTFLTDK